ncbi:hypothetical protein HH1059_12100 [Halorhodospira halochloris]|uniref:Ribbon-helix-helix protein CopG domain-containing protein n=1 Tax=Halorhodospira halochloris TaxID=1052 RepID=A0A0X8X9K9_HALHR|nr:ribbon-helix-helix domain-containing protein [Halorhodospira halochloris]MBK1652642.1 hypothetical protein [Halorhodospira halochloris]MCG5548825.1 ribbon-helix-helix domain-containing protein [Halorhodospira halochloris]BAU57904.1 hypothetical protein HH1059_12100 [Halorhodospira halochloris]
MDNTTTSVKIDPELRSRIQRVAELTQRSAHSVMVEALEREVSREESLHNFIQEAAKADQAIDEGGEVYQIEDVHRWLRQLAAGDKSDRPDPWRR